VYFRVERNQKGDLNFTQWWDVLSHSRLPETRRKSFATTIRWYLSFCKRGGERVNVRTAREFMDWAIVKKNPNPALIEEWKEAIRWFFSEAKNHGQNG